MEGSAQRGSGDVAVAHVKTEAADENTPALVVGGHESPAPRGGAACGGGGAAQPAEELADTELQAAATTTPVLLYPVSTDRFFTTSGDGKTYLTIAPASVMPPAPPEKTLPLGSDFSSKAVLCLIEAVGRRWGLYETRERSQLFQSVQEEMASKGHILPVEKIRRKWNNLIVTYKRVKDRSRETGHAKTSWEFFDLMDATLCDTVGSHLANNKRHRGGGSAAALASAPAKVAAKSPLPQAAATIARPHKGDFEMTGGAGAESVGQGAATSQITSVSTAKISSSGASELKPLVVLNGDAGSLHPPTVVPSPPFLSSPCVTETTSTAASFGSAGTGMDPNTPRYLSHEAPSFSPGVVPFRLNVTSHSSSKNLLGLSSSFPPTFSCLAPSAAAAASSSASPLASEGQNQKGDEEQSSLLPEILKRQEEQAIQDRVARRRVEAREKRRERREVRMAESLGRIATALELLSSKQDTVIALLQRLADRK